MLHLGNTPTYYKITQTRNSFVIQQVTSILQSLIPEFLSVTQSSSRSYGNLEGGFIIEI